MKKRTREKIALVAFALLVVFAGVVLTSYFSTGRSWSVAASFLDDAVGSMDGYTALVYAGVIESEDEDEADGDVGDGVDGTAEDAAEDDAAQGDVAGGSSQDDAAAGAEGAAGDVDGSASADVVDGSDASGGSEDAPELKFVLPHRSQAEGEDPTRADSIGLSILSLLPKPSVNDVVAGVYVSDVRELYEGKGARVLSLDVMSGDRYADPQVFIVDGKRIGVYSVSTYTTRATLANRARYFRDKDVDVVVCVTPRSSYLATFSGIDVVLVTSDAEEDIPVNGKTVGETLVAQSPLVGEVGVIMLSTNNVPSVKVVSAL